ncbi:helix-turn-helix domain-containing protein [Vagococcus carniphilus]|uniref:helix-turn-helix domain-containing protein n=1 Tax=Vagococcus carniphilus TaxID=218144 RepID=UPI0028905A52|nr:helix-turn-helix transcriptional regulator [Vagococcus carniphilus]MDT2864287.1 helix-turn-helix transcriptional regulator [Vagococcus carniphilus]
MNESNKKKLGQKIKDIRINRKETLEEFANQIKKKTDFTIKTTKSNVSKWEKGLNIPNDITLNAIAELGHTTVEHLLNQDTDNTAPSSDDSYNEIIRKYGTLLEIDVLGMSNNPKNYTSTIVVKINFKDVSIHGFISNYIQFNAISHKIFLSRVQFQTNASLINSEEKKWMDILNKENTLMFDNEVIRLVLENLSLNELGIFSEKVAFQVTPRYPDFLLFEESDTNPFVESRNPVKGTNDWVIEFNYSFDEINNKYIGVSIDASDTNWKYTAISDYIPFYKKGLIL